jgi:hypothetical protein
VELSDDFRPLKDGTFLWSSERSGWKHLYLHGADGRLIRQVTRGDWTVDALQGVDETRGVAFFIATPPSSDGSTRLPGSARLRQGRSHPPVAGGP